MGRVKVRPVMVADQGKEWRKYFSGDADYQTAEAERREGESLFRVEIEIEGLLSSQIIDGWAVGAEAQAGL